MFWGKKETSYEQSSARRRTKEKMKRWQQLDDDDRRNQQQQQSTIINDDNMHEAINEKEKWPANYYTIERQKRYRWNQPRTDITAVRISSKYCREKNAAVTSPTRTSQGRHFSEEEGGRCCRTNESARHTTNHLANARAGHAWTSTWLYTSQLYISMIVQKSHFDKPERQHRST